MEDGVTEAESFLPPPSYNNSEAGSKRDEKEEGFVSSEKVEKVEQDEAKECSGNGGGLINNLISTFITPLSPRTGKSPTENGAEEATGGEEQKVENGESSKGLISNLVTNFFHPSDEKSEESVVEKRNKEKDVEILGDDKIKRLKTGNETKGGDRGIIHDIVSHLPASLPDDAAPTADEATILINSLVRD